MATGKHGSPEWTISYDDAPGGTLRSMGNMILSIGGIKIENAMQLSHAFGDSWEESNPTGMRKVTDITVGGLFDDTATTGPHTVFRVVDGDVDPNGATRSFSASPASGTGNTFAGETRLMSYEVLGKLGALSEFAAVIRFTGACTWS